MKKEHIIEEIIRTTQENSGKPLGKERFEKETGIKYSDWFGKYWTKWGDAIKEAGFTPNKFNQAYDDEFLLRKLIDFIREIKKFPTWGEIRLKANNDKDFPWHNTFQRLGKKNELAKKILAYCDKHDEFNDVMEICLPICNPDNENDEVKLAEDKDEDTFGFVYLMKSGKYYKIGRSDNPHRRNYELGIQLPERLEIVHRIKTDDPVGIEAYWHKRFEAKRKKGEWFDLAGPDLRAFKRRKFM